MNNEAKAWSICVPFLAVAAVLCMVIGAYCTINSSNASVVDVSKEGRYVCYHPQNITTRLSCNLEAERPQP